jgi:hypothetical protein
LPPALHVTSTGGRFTAQGKYLCLKHIATLTSPMRTGTSTSGPMTAAQLTHQLACRTVHRQTTAAPHDQPESPGTHRASKREQHAEEVLSSRFS